MAGEDCRVLSPTILPEEVCLFSHPGRLFLRPADAGPPSLPQHSPPPPHSADPRLAKKLAITVPQHFSPAGPSSEVVPLIRRRELTQGYLERVTPASTFSLSDEPTPVALASPEEVSAAFHDQWTQTDDDKSSAPTSSDDVHTRGESSGGNDSSEVQRFVAAVRRLFKFRDAGPLAPTKWTVRFEGGFPANEEDVPPVWRRLASAKASGDIKLRPASAGPGAPLKIKVHVAAPHSAVWKTRIKGPSTLSADCGEPAARESAAPASEARCTPPKEGDLIDLSEAQPPPPKSRNRGRCWPALPLHRSI